ncbi:MAG: hypothetical protein A3K22_05885, partial [Deltaproteobacteria bacterium RBG_16_42_7]
SGKLPERDVYRSLVLNDLWFIVYFVMGVKPANHPFVVGVAQDVENGPRTGTLDIWAREHYKSSIITIAETLQYHLRNPEHCSGLFSYVRPVAKAFLRSIKILCENSDLLKACFPDVLWQNPMSEAPKWSEDDGLIFKRKSFARKESTVEGWGLIEGMPTSKHFDRRIYDDIETFDIADSADMLNKCFEKFEMSDNLGMDGGIERVNGTFYNHNGPLKRIMDKKDINGNPMYLTRIKPATHDGTLSGRAVLLSEERLAKLKMSITFNSQQLCDPTPKGTQLLNSSMLQYISIVDIPLNLYKFMMVDPAGDGKDSWGIFVCGVEPVVDEIGASNVYILDCIIDNMSVSSAIETVAKMYMRNGIIEQIGVEKVGLSTMEVHVANTLNKQGRRVSIEDKTLVLLKPAGRSKVSRIENAIAWPLLNSKISISDYVPISYRTRLKQEMDEFPFGKHDDGIDALSYLYDMLNDYGFKYKIRKKITKTVPIQMVHVNQGWMAA